MINKFLYPNGGSETYVIKLGEALSKYGHEVQYFGMEHLYLNKGDKLFLQFFVKKKVKKIRRKKI